MCRGGEVQRCRGLQEVLSAEMQKCRNAEVERWSLEVMRRRGGEVERCRGAEA